jgi:GntR family transcriptional regulator/MocR family aminotransferase
MENAPCGVQLDHKRTNFDQKRSTNSPDWSTLVPVLPGDGPRAKALYGAIRHLIESGGVPAGAKLPTTRDLARRFKLSRASAIAAFELLASEGFVEARVGAGTYVANQVPHLPREKLVSRRSDLAEQPALPLTLGVTMSDPRTARIFRRLMSRHLARPGAEHFRYGDPRGGLALREAIASYLRSARGVRCEAHQIVVTAGAQQALDLLIHAAIRPGDPVWVEDPCYRMALTALKGAGAHIVGVPVDAEGLDPARGEKLSPDARAVYVTPSHQFPLGVTMTMRRRLALLDWARRKDAWIIEDDYDSEFRYAGPPLTALQGMDGAGRVAYIGTFSKVLFPGLRTGYLVVPEPLLERVLEVRARSDRFPTTLTEAPLAELLSQGHFVAHLRRVRRRVQAARDVLVATLQAHARGRLDIATPEQGLHLVAKTLCDRPDIEIAAAAKAEGVGARALSPLFIAAPPVQGLVLGFSSFGNEAIKAAAMRLCAVLAS